MQQGDSSNIGKIYLLMGYLGSGKTTFIRNLLQNKHNKKYAVIQNQFASGEMGIQQPLIMDESGVPFSSFLQLPNGCICCSAKNDLIASIEYILENTDVRNIIVETNGLADPAESIKQFWFDQQMKINGYLHSVISIFSLQRFKTAKGEQLLQKQIVFANKALVTFVDKSTQQQVQTLYDYIKQRNQECEIERNDKYDVVEFISGKSLFDIRSLNDIDAKFHSCPRQCTSEHQHKHKHLHHGINSIFIKGSTSLCTKKEIETRVGQLLWESGMKVLRLKGVYCLQGEENVLELQAVDDIFQVKESKTHKDKYKSETKVLAIVQDGEQEEKGTQSLEDKLREALGIK